MAALLIAISLGDGPDESRRVERATVATEARRVFPPATDWAEKLANQDWAHPNAPLREESDSPINKHFGLYAAMTALRHADIKATSSYYTDNRQRICTSNHSDA
jgi:hypothetical protein